ncbi:MAG: hypothetical protein ACE5R4_12290 [Armatimonadota bacterium]
MSPKTGIRCSCGQRISAREVLKHGIMMAHWQPLYAYIRYRCSRCQRLGERVVDYKRWDQSELRESASEVTQEERAKFERLPPITSDEIIRFAKALAEAGDSDVISVDSTPS